LSYGTELSDTSAKGLLKAVFEEKKVIFPAGGMSLYRKGIIVPLAIPLPFRDPFEVYQKVSGKGPTVFLDSTRFHPETATYSYIGLRPFSHFEFRTGKNPIEQLRRFCGGWKGRAWPEFPHFTGGGVGFLSYELSRDLEKVRWSGRETFLGSKIHLLFFRDLFVFDFHGERMLVLTNLLPDRDGSPENALKAARERIRDLKELFARDSLTSPGKGISAGNFRSCCNSREFECMVRKAKEYIRQGDIYQVNLSRRFSFDFKGDPLKLYGRLRDLNPSPFSSFLDFGKVKIISASPERLIRLEGDHCETRPIAGTYRRGKTLAESRKLSRALLRDSKERAEHLMLVDLERNDLGRVCDYRTVRVEKMMMLEKYSHVIHIVSRISGKLAKGKDRFDLLKAMFPGGTITGCPKIRSMEIIDELESSPRGLYTGSVGYLDFGGNMDWNIVIRTILLQGRRGFVQTGAGIVHDSKPAKEYRETLHKAKALFLALDRAEE